MADNRVKFKTNRDGTVDLEIRRLTADEASQIVSLLPTISANAVAQDIYEAVSVRYQDAFSFDEAFDPKKFIRSNYRPIFSAEGVLKELTNDDILASQSKLNALQEKLQNSMVISNGAFEEARVQVLAEYVVLSQLRLTEAKRLGDEKLIKGANELMEYYCAFAAEEAAKRL